MKTWKFVLIVFGCMLVTMPQAMAMKYTIDGDLSDWGITDQDLQNGLNDNNDESAWIPDAAGPKVSWVVENDVYADPTHPGYPDKYLKDDGKEYYDYGVHIKGKGTTYNPYFEPKVDGKVQPVGGETFDVEALYLDEDKDYIYVAIVTSMPPEGICSSTGRCCSATDPYYCPGDLAIDIDFNLATGGLGYEYGVRLGSYDSNQFKIYRTDEDEDWYKTQVCPSNKPATVNVAHAGNPVGSAIGAYVFKGNWETPYNKPVYVIELAIPKTVIGSTSSYQVHHAEAGCGNDAVDQGIPEFPTLLIPVGIVVGLFYYFTRRR